MEVLWVDFKHTAAFTGMSPKSSVLVTGLHNAESSWEKKMSGGKKTIQVKNRGKMLGSCRPADLNLSPRCSQELRVSLLLKRAPQRCVADTVPKEGLSQGCTLGDSQATSAEST